MNINTQKRLKQIKIENNIWFIYFFIIGFSLYANQLERDYFLTGNKEKKESYRAINAFVFLVLIIVYSYFEKDSLQSFLEKENKSNQQKQFDCLSLIATSFVLLSGIIFLYIILADDELYEEIAFN